MTMKTEESVVVERPIDSVWRFVSSENLAKAMPGVIDWKKTSVGPYGVGTTFREMRSKTPKVMDYRVTEFENFRLGLEITSGPIRGTRITESVENVEGKTRLTETAHYNLSGLWKLARPFLDRPGKAEREAMERLNAIKHFLETEAKP